MAYYRLYFMEHDHVAGFDAFEADDDEAAVAYVSTNETGEMELWCGARRVKQFQTEDHHAGGR